MDGLAIQAPTESERLDRLVAVGTSAQEGSNSRLIRIEASFGRGFSGLQMIGHTGQIADDGKERARMALERLGMELPARKLLMSVSPGDVKVDGNHLDLAFAVAMASLMNPRPPVIDPALWVFAAEIGLGGELRPVPGVVCHGVAAMSGATAGVVVAHQNLPELVALEAASAKTNRVLTYRSFQTLREVLDWLWSGVHRSVDDFPIQTDFSEYREANFDDMDLDDEMRHTAIAAAAGMHSMILRGVPGCGKSMFAKRIQSLLPDLTPEEHLSVLEIHSSHAERIARPILSGRPPYRSPHHFASNTAMLGGHDRPGEVTLASGGVLFLDEFPEFRRDVIEALREPLESGEVQVSRAQSKRTWRAKMLLIAAANNCPCGWRGSAKRRCLCAEGRFSAYNNRLSGPILDRIDIHVNMPERADGAAFIFSPERPSRQGLTDRMRESVHAARERATARNATFQCQLNRDIPPQHLGEALGTSAQNIDRIVKKWMPAHVSTRSVVRCLRVARTLADMRDDATVKDSDIAQAWSWQAFEAAKMRGELLDIR